MIIQLIVVLFCVSNFVRGETEEILRTSSGEERIVGGALALHNEYPFIVSIQDFAPGAKKGHKFCGGSIIDKRWVLTAAHCFKDIADGLDIYINAGTNNAFTYSGTSQLVLVEHYFQHEYYSPTSNEHDICLLKLIKPLTFTDSVHAIHLPSADYNPEVKGYGVIMGWGAVDPMDYSSGIGQLKKTIQDVMSQEKCLNHWPGLLDTQLCIYDKLHPSGDCAGDSGGPFIQFIDGKAYAVGITSFGRRRCGSEPTIYTRVSKYLTWINSTISANSYRKVVPLKSTKEDHFNNNKIN